MPTRQPLKSDLETIVRELAGLPQVVASIDSRLAKVEAAMQECRDSAIRTTEQVSAVRESLHRLNGRLEAVTQKTAQNTNDIAGLSTWVKIVGGLGGLGTLIGIIIGTMMAIK